MCSSLITIHMVVRFFALGSNSFSNRAALNLDASSWISSGAEAQYAVHIDMKHVHHLHSDQDVQPAWSMLTIHILFVNVCSFEGLVDRVSEQLFRLHDL